MRISDWSSDVCSSDLDTDSNDFKKKPKFEIFFIQAKRTEGFAEAPIDKFVSVTNNLFDLSKDVEEFEKLYNSQIIDLFRYFRCIYIDLASKQDRKSVV